MKRLTLDVAKWDIYQHRSARGIEQADVCDSKVMQFGDELYDRLVNGDDGVQQLPASKRDAKLSQWAGGVHDACSKIPQFERLAEQVRSIKDETARAGVAGMAVEQLMSTLGPALKDVEYDRPGALQPPKSIDPGQVKKFEESLRRMVRRATTVAQQSIEDVVEAEGALDQFVFGWQPGNQTADHAASAGERVRQIANALQSRPRLKKLADMIGRFRRLAAKKQKQKVRHGVDEINDVVHGNNLARILPKEILKLADTNTKLMFLRDYQNRALMQWETTGVETKTKGPMVVCIDKSGSMSGDPNDWATAVALALGDIAVREGRVFALLSFDTKILHETVTLKGEKLDARALDVECDGGTDIDVAYARAIEIIRQNPGTLAKADIVMITDGGSDQCRTAELREAAKALGIQTFGMAIGVNAECLQPWCDEVQTIEDVYGLDDELATQLFAA